MDGRSDGNSHTHHLFIYILHKTRYIYTYIHRFDTHLHAFVDQGIFPFRPSIGHFITLTTTVRAVTVRKGNYTLLARKMAAAVGWERVYMQPFDLFLGSLKKRLSEGVGGQRSSMQLRWRFLKPSELMQQVFFSQGQISNRHGYSGFKHGPWAIDFILQSSLPCGSKGIMKGFLTLAVFFCHEVTAAVLSEDRRSCPYYQVHRGGVHPGVGNGSNFSSCAIR